MLIHLNCRAPIPIWYWRVWEVVLEKTPYIWCQRYKNLSTGLKKNLNQVHQLNRKKKKTNCILEFFCDYLFASRNKTEYVLCLRYAMGANVGMVGFSVITKEGYFMVIWWRMTLFIFSRFPEYQLCILTL